MITYNAKIITSEKLTHADVSEDDEWNIDIDSLELPKSALVDLRHDGRIVLGTARNFKKNQNDIFCEIQIKEPLPEGIKWGISPELEYERLSENIMKNAVLKGLAITNRPTDKNTFLERKA